MNTIPPKKLSHSVRNETNSSNRIHDEYSPGLGRHHFTASLNILYKAEAAASKAAASKTKAKVAIYFIYLFIDFFVLFCLTCAIRFDIGMRGRKPRYGREVLYHL